MSKKGLQKTRMCLGVLNYSKKYGNHVLEECCRQALAADKVSYTYIKNSIPAIADDLSTPQERSRINEERNRGGFIMESDAMDVVNLLSKSRKLAQTPGKEAGV